MENGRNFLTQWKKVFMVSEKTSANILKPGNFYKINVYEYVDGVTKSLSGANETYIFLIGKFSQNKKNYVSALKLKGIDPKLFFEYIKLFIRSNPLTEEKINDTYKNTKTNRNNEFSELLKNIQPDGKNLFSIFKSKKNCMEGYREYISTHIRSIEYLDVNPEYLKIKLTKESKTSQNLKLERNFLNERKAKNAKQIVKPKKVGSQIDN